MQKTLVYIICLWTFLACKEERKVADVMIKNAHIYTMDTAFSKAQVLVISDGKIVEVGNEELEANWKASKVFDLNGAFVYPGFIDAHTHFYHYGMGLKEVNLVGTGSFDEVLQRLESFQKVNQREFIHGRGWDQNDWEIKTFPNKAKLDSLFPEIPVLLKRIDGHAALANQAALDYAGIDLATTINGGVIESENGELTGILIDNAVGLVKVPEMSRQDKIDALLEAQQNLFDVGLTSVVDAGLNRQEIELIDSLQRSGLLKIRVYAMVSDSPENMDYYMKKGPIKTNHLTVNSFKFYLDGALGSRGALMLEPYSDDTANYGLLLGEISHFKEAAKKLSEAGWQMCTHAIGDSANRLALSIYRDALHEKEDHRWRIEHAQIVQQNDIERFGKLGVIPSVQPTHATSDMYWAEERLGGHRMNQAYPYQSLLQSADLLALGTDFPVEDIDPLKTFYAAVFRQDDEHFPPNGFISEEKLSRQAALKGMTIWAAYANFEEEQKGSIEAGKWADITVLDTDLMQAGQDDILKAEVIVTFLAGQKVNTR